MFASLAALQPSNSRVLSVDAGAAQRGRGLRNIVLSLNSLHSYASKEKKVSTGRLVSQLTYLLKVTTGNLVCKPGRRTYPLRSSNAASHAWSPNGAGEGTSGAALLDRACLSLKGHSDYAALLEPLTNDGKGLQEGL